MMNKRLIAFLFIALLIGIGAYSLTMGRKTRDEAQGKYLSPNASAYEISAGKDPQFDSIGYLRVSPDGRKLAFTAKKQNELIADFSLFIFDLKDKKLQKILGNVGAYFSWSPDGKGIYYEKRSGGNKAPDIYYIDISRKKSQLIATSSVHPSPSPDGVSIAYLPRNPVRHREEETEWKPGIVYQRGKSSKKLFLHNSLVFHFNWSTDGRYIGALAAQLSPPGPPFYAIIDTQKGTEKVIGNLTTSPFAIALPTAPAFLNSKKFLFVQLEQGQGFEEYILKLVELDLSTSKRSVIFQKRTKSLQIMDMRASPKGDKCLIVVGDMTQTKRQSCDILLFDAQSRKIKEGLIRIDYGIGNIDWQINDKDLIFAREGHIYLLPLGGKEKMLL